MLGWSVYQVKYHMNKLRKWGFVTRTGTRHNGVWVIHLPKES